MLYSALVVLTLAGLLAEPKTSHRDNMNKVFTIESNYSEVIKQLTSIMLVVLMGLLVYSVLTQVSGWFTIHNFKFDFASQFVFLLLKVWLPWLVLLPLVALLVVRFPINPENGLARGLLHCLFLMGLSLIHMAGVSYHYHFFEDMSPLMATYEPWQHIGHFLFGDSIFLYNTIIYTLIIANFNLKRFYQAARDSGAEAEALSHKLTESKLIALRMQINPHFLFNTLNAISVLILKKDHKKAGEMIERLSSFFRASLDETGKKWVPLAQELNMLNEYLSIERVRFGERLLLENDLDPQAMPVLVPPMILQPLVENAIIHGLGKVETQASLKIMTQCKAGRLIIEISDSGAGCDFNDSKLQWGVGLTNIQERLLQIYQAQSVFKMEGKIGQGVKAYIELPITPPSIEQGELS